MTRALSRELADSGPGLNPPVALAIPTCGSAAHISRVSAPGRPIDEIMEHARMPETALARVPQETGSVAPIIDAVVGVLHQNWISCWRMLFTIAIV